jgi:hypothetical protein
MLLLAGMHQEVFRKTKTALKASERPKLFGETLGFGRLYFRTSSNLRLLQAPWRLQPRLPDSVKSHS